VSVSTRYIRFLGAEALTGRFDGLAEPVAAFIGRDELDRLAVVASGRSDGG